MRSPEQDLPDLSDKAYKSNVLSKLSGLTNDLGPVLPNKMLRRVRLEEPPPGSALPVLFRAEEFFYCARRRSPHAAAALLRKGAPLAPRSRLCLQWHELKGVPTEEQLRVASPLPLPHTAAFIEQRRARAASWLRDCSTLRS